MLKDRLRCWVNLHQPVRNRVRTEGPIFRGQCKTCHSMIYRESPGRWREDRLVGSGGLPRRIPPA